MYPPLSFRIDGVVHDIGVMAVLDFDEHLPGGLTWTMELHRSSLAGILDSVCIPHRGRPARTLERSLRSLMRRVVRGDRPPRFCITSIDTVDILERRVTLGGRCAPLIIAVLRPSGPT